MRKFWAWGLPALAVLLVAVAVVVSVRNNRAAAPTGPVALAPSAAAPSAALPVATTEPGLPPPPEDPKLLGAKCEWGHPVNPAAPKKRLFVIGDSVSFCLFTNFHSAWAPGLAVEGVAKLGCGLVPGALVVSGKADKVPPQCPAWPAEWKAAAAKTPHDVALIMVGNGELFDHVVGGKTLAVGSPAYAAYLDAEWSAYVKLLGDKVLLSTAPCYTKADDGLTDAAKTTNDAGRRLWLNEQVRTFASKNPTTVTVLDLEAVLCPGGAPLTEKDGIPMRSDGIHPTLGGVRYVWQSIGPTILNL